MTKWEYQTVLIPLDNTEVQVPAEIPGHPPEVKTVTREEGIQILNTLGDEGWEAVGIDRFPRPHFRPNKPMRQFAWVLFKRIRGST